MFPRRVVTAVRRRVGIVLCIVAAPLGVGQSRTARPQTPVLGATQTKPTIGATQTQNKPAISATQAQIPPRRLPPSVVPALFAMNRNEVARALEPLHLRPSFSGPDNAVTVAQKPEAGTTVPFGSVVAVTLGQLRLVLSGPAAPAFAGSELTFTAAFVPPLPAGVKVSYFFQWGDGSPMESTANAVVTHRFADAGNRVVSVVGVVDGRFRIGSRVPVDILPLPTTDTTPTMDTTPSTTDATTPDTTATVTTEVPATSGTTATTESTTSSATATTAPTTTSTTTIEPTPATTTPAAPAPPPPDPSSNPLAWIGAAVIILLLVVSFLLARVLRALNRKAPDAHAQAKSPVAFNGGMRSTIEYEIDRPELIRRGPAVGLRGGIRGEGDGDV